MIMDWIYFGEVGNKSGYSINYPLITRQCGLNYPLIKNGCLNAAFSFHFLPFFCASFETRTWYLAIIVTQLLFTFVGFKTRAPASRIIIFTRAVDSERSAGGAGATLMDLSNSSRHF